MTSIEPNSLLSAYNIACGAFFISVLALIIAGWALFCILKQKRHQENSLCDEVSFSGCYKKTMPDETFEKGRNASLANQQPKTGIISFDDGFGENNETAKDIENCVPHNTLTEDTSHPKSVGLGNKQTSTISNLVSSDFLYATAIDEGDNKTFIRVENTPSKGETIFKFVKIQEGKCEFEVYEGAYSLVLKESEYLKDACTLNKVGNSKISTTKKGTAELNGDGKWCVKEQAKVKFE